MILQKLTLLCYSAVMASSSLQEQAEIVVIDEMAVSNIVFKTLADSNNRFYVHLITSEGRHSCPV